MGTGRMRPPPKKQFTWDPTGDGEITTGDVGWWWDWSTDWLGWGYFLPGDYAIDLLTTHPRLTAIGDLYEVSPDWYGGWISGGVSLVAWFIALMMFRRFTRFGHWWHGFGRRRIARRVNQNKRLRR